VDPAGDYGIVGVAITSEVLVQAMASMPQLLGCIIQGLQGFLKVHCLSQVILRRRIFSRVVLGESGGRLVQAGQGFEVGEKLVSLLVVVHTTIHHHHSVLPR
jgi:hypothetical protein